MAEEGIEPDVVTYGAMLSALDKAGQWREALDLYDRLLADPSNIKPNLYIYSSVLNACEKGRQWDRATELFKAMLENGNEELVPMSSIAILARKAMYASPAILSALPDPLVTAAKSVVDTGRAARQWIWKSSSVSNE
jgi:pentatricopeptide repeat domain-containing protein 1